MFFTRRIAKWFSDVPVPGFPVLLWLLVSMAAVPQAAAQCSINSWTSGYFLSESSTGARADFEVTGTNCSWMVSTTTPWITLTAPTSGVASNTTVLYDFTTPVNGTGLPRQGTVTIVVSGGVTRTLVVVQNPTTCAFTLTSPATPVSAAGGTVPITISTNPPGCWAAQSTTAPAWISGAVILSPADAPGDYPTATVTVSPNSGPSRSVTLTYYSTGTDQASVTITQDGTCAVSLGVTSAEFSFAGGNATVGVTAASCSWTATSNASWIQITSGGSGTGNGVVNYTVQPNSGAARSGTMTIGGQTFTVNQGAGCAGTYSINPTSTQIAASGGTGSVSVTTNAGCAWTAISNAGWIQITSGAAGNGSGAVDYSVQANAGSARSGTIAVAGQTFTVNQPAPCAYNLSSTSASVGSGTGGGSVNVLASTGCVWSATANHSWIHITSGSSGNGNGTVAFSVDANPGAARSGTITAAGLTFTVNQAGTCTYNLSATSAAVGSGIGGGSFNVIAASGCTWSATANDSWIHISSGSSGNGNGTVTFSVDANPGVARSGTITAAGLAFTVNQAGTCSYTLSPPSASFNSAGGSGTVSVSTAAGCAWTAVANDGFLSISGSASRTGPGDIGFQVSSNSAGGQRNGSLTIAGINFPVSQAGIACTPSLSPSSLSVGAAASAPTVTLTMNASGCPWSITNLPSWITAPAGGNGTANFSLNIAANPLGTGRSASITIAGLILTVAQASADCTAITLSESSQSFPASGGQGSVQVTAPAGCSYPVSSSGAFVQIPSPGSRVGAVLLPFTVLTNSGAPRTATLNIGSRSLVVSQAADTTPTVACTTSTSPATVRSLGRTEQLGELDLVCSGRTGGAAFSADVLVLLNVAVTNRILSAATETVDARLTIQGGGTIQGQLDGVNAIRFRNVPFSSGEPALSLAMRIVNLRGDASQAGTATQGGSPITASVSVIAPLPVPVLQPVQTIASSTTAFSFTRRPAQGNIVSVSWQEAFASAFKTRDGEAGGGSADTATRLMLRLRGIPAGFAVYAPVASVNNEARLMTADSNGIGGSPAVGEQRAGGLYSRVNVLNGSATVTWEIAAVAGTQIDAPEFRMLIENATSADIDQIAMDGLLGPVSEIAQASTAAPIPRFLEAARPPRLVNLRLSTDPVSSVGSGSAASFRFRIRNDSDNNADDVLLRVTLPPGLISPSCDAPGCVVQDQQVRLRFNTIGAGASVTVGVTAQLSPAVTQSSRDTSGQPTCPNCVGNGSILQVGAGVGSSQTDNDVSDNYVKSDVPVTDTCRYSLNPALIPVGPGESIVTVTVETGPACEWALPVSSGVVTFSQGGSQRGRNSVQATVPANVGGARTLEIPIQDQILRVVQAASGCTFTLTGGPASLPAAGGTFSVNIQTGANCQWQAAAAPDWLRITGQAAGIGSQTLQLSAQGNAGLSPRSGIVTVSGQRITILQSPATVTGPVCTFTLSSASIDAPSAGAQGSISVTTQSGCLWSPVASESWITVSASGNSLSYQIASNSGAARTGTIIVGSQIVSVSQGGSGPISCTYTTNRSGATASATGDSLGVNVLASNNSCSWTAASEALWVTFPGGLPRNGSGVLRITVAPNASTAVRVANLTIAGRPFTVSQAGSGCTFTIAPATQSAAGAGGNYSLNVTSQGGCVWSPVSSQPFVAITQGSINSGSGSVSYSVSANTGSVPRTASISVAGENHQVIQAAANPAQQFGDVPISHPFYDFISVMRDKAITAGCTGSTYCPDAVTTRGQMAVFIIRALLGGDSFAFPATPYFTDVAAGHPFFKWIQKMRELGITTGCTATTYCPDSPVTRGQMAAFIVRARLGLAGGDPLAFPSAAFFGDVPGTHPFYGFVQKMRQLAVTSGCTASSYCPDSETTRGQMSVFIVRGLLTP